MTGPTPARESIFNEAVLGLVAAAAAFSPSAALAQSGIFQAPGGAPKGAEPDVSLAEAFFIQRHPVTHQVEWLGSMIIWSLMALSAASIALIVIQWLGNRRKVVLPDALLRRAQSLMRGGRAGELPDFLRKDPSYLAKVLLAALSEPTRQHGAMVRAAEHTADALLVTKLRRLEPLSVIGNVAPMIGLFGTVYGIILAFREIVSSGGAPDPVSLAAGIGTALTSTFWGLVVAIPALAAFGLLRNSIDALTAEADAHIEDLLETTRPRPAPSAAHASPRPVESAAAPAGARAGV